MDNIPDYSCLIAKPRDSKEAIDKKNENLTPLMKKKIIPCHPFSILFSAPSGSGKSTLLLHMLEDPNFYGKYFDVKNILIFSLTAKSDPLYKDINIPKKNIFTDNFQKHLDNFVQKRKKMVEKRGKLNTQPTLLIFEDSTNERRFMRSKSFLNSFVLLRHLNCSIMSVVHKLRSLERTARMSVGHLIIFPCALNEIYTIIDDFAPPNMNKKKFLGLINECFQPTEKDSHPFMYISNSQPYKIRYRKGFYQIMELD